ncbi:MAG: toxic anion resistance protein [Solirubrobacterales bacterium]
MSFSDEKDFREIQEKLESISEELKQSPEVIKIAKEIDVSNINYIINFGRDLEKEFSNFTDRIMNCIKTFNVKNIGVTIEELKEILNNFYNEAAKGSIEQILKEIDNLDSEIQRIYFDVTKYNNEMVVKDKELQGLYLKNFEFFKEFEKNTAACSLIIDEIEREDLPYWEQRAKYGYGDDNIKLQELSSSIHMLKHRLLSLENSKLALIEAAAQIKIIQKENLKLEEKIKSALIIPISILKNELILRRQAITGSYSTSTLLKVEALEDSWKKIIEDINDTKKIEMENKKIREVGINKIKSKINFK